MNERDTRLRVDTLSIEAERFDADEFKRALTEALRGGGQPSGQGAEARAVDAVLRAAGTRRP